MNNGKNKTTAKASQKRPFSCISCCFTASPVLDEDWPIRPALAGGSKRKPPPWFPWARSPKKMKPTAPVETPVESFAAKNPRTRPGAPKSSSMGDYGPVLPLELEQTNLPLVATHEDSRRLSSGSSFNRTGSSTSKPETPRQIAGGASAAAAADSNVLVRRETLEPVVGLWLMVAMLAIMLLAGPAAAVVCFCSCLYMCPRSSTTAVAAADCGGLSENLNSAEHKKRVILEGLLERKGRRPIAASTDRMR